MRDSKTDEIKHQVGQGVKLKMDSAGNILIRRYSRSNVYVKSTANGLKDETSMSADILKLPNQALESEKVVKLFDMKKFQSNINRELRQAYPDRRRLELQCLSAVTFVRSENDVLDCPIWVLVINVVAMDMLKSKLPPMERPINVKSRPRLPIPDEDPYYIPGTVMTRITDSSDSGYGGITVNSSINSNRALNNATDGLGQIISPRDQFYQSSTKGNEKPPQLPPREGNAIYPQNLPTPDYDENEENKPKSFFRGFGSKDKARKKYVTEDPYYCGLSARTPKFEKTTLKKQSKNHIAVPKRMSVAYLQHPVAYVAGYQYASHQQLMQPRQHFQMMWQARSMESGLDYPSQFNANLYGFDKPDYRVIARRPTRFDNIDCRTLIFQEKQQIFSNPLLSGSDCGGKITGLVMDPTTAINTAAAVDDNSFFTFFPEDDETDERKKNPEDISKVLESHGGSLNLKEFTNVKESAEKHYFLVTNGNGDIVSLKKIVLLAFERKNNYATSV
ncbi:hypothetical protein Bhyg_07180 [Pseudolycoriella hygida]|uniref:MH2 domain-containing protein n=1 Tax=Pseudolycoriella hygida TaxID=35572 RepID=A0A9Q0N244_9DIPT|nr:hypothetical protein Bhyg_07180 [Pseudolycoriella hygida]